GFCVSAPARDTARAAFARPRRRWPGAAPPFLHLRRAAAYRNEYENARYRWCATPARDRRRARCRPRSALRQNDAPSELHAEDLADGDEAQTRIEPLGLAVAVPHRQQHLRGALLPRPGARRF